MSSSTYTNYKGLGWERHSCLLLAAPRKSGKTYLINKLLIEGGLADLYDYIIIASPTLEFKDDYPIENKVSKHTQVKKIKSNFKARLDQMMEDQKRVNKLAYDEPERYDPIHTLLILDDCVDSKLAAYGSSENIADELVERGRHYNVSLICSAQQLSSLSPALRRNAEKLILFSPTNYAVSFFLFKPKKLVVC